MTTTHEEKDGRSVVRIDGEMTIYEAEELRDLFARCMENTGGLTLNLERVESFDITGVQLLFSAVATSRATGKPVSVTHISPAVSETLAAAGVNPEKVGIGTQEVKHAQSRHDRG